MEKNNVPNDAFRILDFPIFGLYYCLYGPGDPVEDL